MSGYYVIRIFILFSFQNGALKKMGETFSSDADSKGNTNIVALQLFLL